MKFFFMYEHQHNIFIIVIDGARRFTICLRSRTCSCVCFQLNEISCSLAISAIRHMNEHGKDWTYKYYSNRNFEDAYAIPVEPLPCESTLKIPSHIFEDKLLPPDFKRTSGRPSHGTMKVFC